MPLTIKIKLREMGFPLQLASQVTYIEFRWALTYSKEEYDRLIATVISKGYKGWTLKK